MNRLLALLFLAACSSSEPDVRYLRAAELPDAAPESAADAPDAQAWPDAQLDATAPEAGQPDAGADAIEEGEAETGDAADAAPCPVDMVDLGSMCFDATESTYAQIAAWIATSPTPPAGCDASDLHQSASILSMTTWCTATGWCASQGKRLCTAQEWIDACNAGADMTPDKTKLDWEWIGHGPPPMVAIGDIGPPCQSMSVSSSYSDQSTARVRCCADPQ